MSDMPTTHYRTHCALSITNITSFAIGSFLHHVQDHRKNVDIDRHQKHRTIYVFQYLYFGARVGLDESIIKYGWQYCVLPFYMFDFFIYPIIM